MENFDWIKGFVFPYINFAIFLFLAFKLFKKPLINMMASKKVEFERLVKEANRAKEEAEKKNLELTARLDRMDREIAEMQEKALKDAKERADDMVAKAAQLASHLKEEAHRMAEAELVRARKALRAEIIAEAKTQTIKKIQTDLDEKSQVNLVHKKITQLETAGV